MSEYYNLQADYVQSDDAADAIEYEPSEDSQVNSPTQTFPALVE